MQALPIPSDGDRNRAPGLLALFWTPFPITLFLVSTRVYVRTRMKNFGWDDGCMIAAWVSMILNTIAAAHSDIKGYLGFIYRGPGSFYSLRSQWRCTTSCFP